MRKLEVQWKAPNWEKSVDLLDDERSRRPGPDGGPEGWRRSTRFKRQDVASRGRGTRAHKDGITCTPRNDAAACRTCESDATMSSSDASSEDERMAFRITEDDEEFEQTGGYYGAYY